MSWWKPRPRPAPALAVQALSVPVPPALTASATEIDTRGKSRVSLNAEQWQSEVWGYYDELGEFRFGVNWLAAAISRVRLRAARVEPGQDEPEIVDKGPAADLIAELAGGVTGRAAMMSRLGLLLSLPGEGYLLGEEVGGVNEWRVCSSDEVRGRPSGGLQVIDEENTRPGSAVEWRDVAAEHFLCRIWRPHARFGYLADSPSRTAVKTMRELDLANRRIIAQYLSRLASAGMIVLPMELDFPVRPAFLDAANPFMMEWLTMAKEAIATPGSAAAAVPMPVQAPGELLDKIKFIDFTTAADDKMIEKRESAIRRLATHMDLPAEVMLGMGEANHWTAWQLEESAIKLHIAPPVEIICGGLTRGYLAPRLEAAGENPADWVVWYDASELTQRPDRSNNATEAYDRLELSGKAYRRELGFDEDDAPDDTELREQLLRKAAALELSGVALALDELTGTDVTDKLPGPTGGEQEGDDVADKDKPADGPPQRDTDAPDVDPAIAASGPRGYFNAPLDAAKVADHRLHLDFGGGWRLLHPAECEHKAAVCPVTWAVHHHPGFAPGTPGRYRLTLGASGIALGEQVVFESNGDHPVSSQARP